MLSDFEYSKEKGKLFLLGMEIRRPFLKAEILSNLLIVI